MKRIALFAIVLLLSACAPSQAELDLARAELERAQAVSAQAQAALTKAESESTVSEKMVDELIAQAASGRRLLLLAAGAAAATPLMVVVLLLVVERRARVLTDRAMLTRPNVPQLPPGTEIIVHPTAGQWAERRAVERHGGQR